MLTPPHLENDDKKEVEVGHAVELLVQVQGQEGEDVVLGRVDDIALERQSARHCCRGQEAPRPPRPAFWLLPALTELVLGADSGSRAVSKARCTPGVLGGALGTRCTLKVSYSFNSNWGGAKEAGGGVSSTQRGVLRSWGLRFRAGPAGEEGAETRGPTLYFLLCQHRKAFSLNWLL